MRKIEREMNAAIANRTNWKGTNTEVSVSDSLIHVYLHGHKIAFETSQGWYISACGWNSVTTRSRLNALAQEIGSSLFHGVSTRQGQLLVRYGKDFAVGNNESFCVHG